jgi:superfamily II DNA or RNA helicase
MKLIVKANEIELIGERDKLHYLHELFSFTDKQTEHLLQRQFKRRERDEAKIQELMDKLIVHCGVFRGESLFLPVGLYDKITKEIKECEVIDERDYDELWPTKIKGYEPTLRTPQKKALAEAIKNGYGLIRMATGVGKTMVGQELIRHFGYTSIFLVPSRQILIQTYERFRSAFGRRSVAIFGDGSKKHALVTVATYQSVFNSSEKEFAGYRLMIADEVHHIGADTFFEVANNRLANCIYRYGLTADEERADGGTILVEASVGPIIYSYEAPEAIRDGYLAQPTFVVYKVSRTQGSYIDWQTTKDNKRVPVGLIESFAYPGDDAHQAYKNWVVGNDDLTHKVSELALNLANEGKSVLILVDEKEHGEKFLYFLKDKAQFVHSGSKGNDEIVGQFNARKLRIVIATSVLGEGADTVPVDVLINLMGGTRPKQANGRALRNDPDEYGKARKPECLILDFDYPRSSVLSRHSLLRYQVHQTCGKVFFHDFI